MSKVVYIGMLCLFAATIVTAQKSTQQIAAITNLDEIRINTDKIFELNIYSTSEKFIRIETHMEGEYYRDTNVITKTFGKSLLVSCELVQDYQIPNDKLSAHKVFAVTMNVYIPKQMQVQIQGDETQVSVTGNFKKLWTRLITGNVTLHNFLAEAKIQTLKGDVYYDKKEMPTPEIQAKQYIFYKNGKKIEITADNGKIMQSATKA